MDIFVLATIGGFISFLSTGAGAVFAGLPIWNRLSHFRLGMDFTLGLMVSAAACSLIWPAFKNSILISPVIWGIFAGVLLVGLLKLWASRLEGPASMNSQVLLALVLMFHNFPEGLASGAALAGLESMSAFPILAGIAFQNFPEGALMVLCLRGLGWTPRNALLGGLASGLLELAAGISAGVILETVQGALPVLLAIAGGAMLTAVAIEMGERGYFKQWEMRRPFMVGLGVIPMLQWLTL